MAMHGVVIKDFHTYGKCNFSSIKVTTLLGLYMDGVFTYCKDQFVYWGATILWGGSSVKVGRLLSFV